MISQGFGRLLKKSAWNDIFPLLVLKAGHLRARNPGSGRSPRQTAKSFGNLARLQAAMVIVNRARTLSRPR